MLTKIITKNFSKTQELGEKMAQNFLIENKNQENALVIALEGELGGGKTTFVQGFAKALGIKEKILSPTFVIFKKFKIANKRFKNFYHFDCYRIQESKEVLNLGFNDIKKDPQNIILIEWAEKIREILPKNTISLKFKFIDKNKREIALKK